ncbi:unnamed protein product [Sphagnum troendelagicum]|uniref:Transcription factor MYC/MYB N-terminal domain-containing protein n=1 Tax=Sphagnum troendelagicum TaxID=128251 RepID=A0ABP0U2S8_9BRYO
MESRQAAAAGGLPTLNHLLQHTLRSLCTDSQWVYAVFWRILPRHYPPPKWETEGGVVDRSRSSKRNWILVWEDGFCNFSVCSEQSAAVQQQARAAAAAPHGNCITSSGSTSELLESSLTTSAASEVLNPELFFKMSHEVYNYGEGLMGKVAASKCHKWVYRDPLENGISSFLPPWHSSLDPHPRTWEAQFKAGIQTVAVVAVQEGLLQLGSTVKIVEDPNFVDLMQRNFNYLQSIPGVFGPHPSSHGLMMSNSMRSSCNGRPVHQHGLGYAGDQELLSDPPPEPGVRGNWIMSYPEDHHQTRSPFMSNGGCYNMSPRAAGDQFLMSSPARTGMMNGWRSSMLQHDSATTNILGMKRGAPDAELHDTSPGLSFDFKDFPYSSSSLGKLRSYAGWRPECPSPPKALNTGRCTASSGFSSLSLNLIPSMSSLDALLSKLPSVTPDQELGHSTHAAAGQLQQQRGGPDSPPTGSAHQATCNSSPTTSNYVGSPPAPAASCVASPMQSQADSRTSPIRCPGAAALQASKSITSCPAASDHHPDVSSPADHPRIGNTADQSSDSRPGSCCTTLNDTPAAAVAAVCDHELLPCNNDCNCNGGPAATAAAVTVAEPFNINVGGSSGNMNSAAAAVSAAPILSASVVTADQRFHEHQQLIGSAAAHVQLSDLRGGRGGGILVNPAMTRDHHQIAATFDNLPDTYFGLHDHDALENNYNSIFSEIY